MIIEYGILIAVNALPNAIANVTIAAFCEAENVLEQSTRMDA